MSFRTRLLVSVLPLIVAVVATSVLILGVQVQANLEAQEERILSLQATSIRSDLVEKFQTLRGLQIRDNAFFVDRVLGEMVERSRQLGARVIVADQLGQIMIPALDETLAPLFLDEVTVAELAPLFDPGQEETDPLRVFKPLELALPDQDARSWLAVAAPMPQENLILLFVTSIDDIRQPLAVALRASGALTVVVLVLATVLLFGLAQTMAKPLANLSRATRMLADGKLDTTIVPEGTRELRRLGLDFNQMARQLAELTASLESRVAERTADLVTTRDQLVQAQKLAALGQLVSGFSHELNTPLGNALTAASFARMVLDGPETSRRALVESLDLVVVSLQRSVDMMHRFRQVSADQIHVQLRPVDLGVWLQRDLTLLVEVHGMGKVRLEVQCEPGSIILVDPAILGQIFSELVDNVRWHAAIDSPARLQIEVRRMDGRVLVDVGDSGPGFPGALRERLFDPFVGTRRSDGLIGLGLHIVHNLVSRQEGSSIRVLEQGQGAALRLEWPEWQPGPS